MKKPRTRRAVQIKVAVQGTTPQVWRRILVSDRIDLLALHEVIQDAFGWWDYHLHEFRIFGVLYGDPENDEEGDLDLQDETQVKLRDLELREGDRFTYVYDFGDYWRHTLLVEKILPVENRAKLPRCIDGRRACPPEDVGGTDGYAEFLRAIANPRHPEHDSYLVWVGGTYDPDTFDPQEANKRIAARDLARRSPVWGAAPEPRAPAPASFDDFPGGGPPGAAGHESTARELPLRRDSLAFLSYIRDHKVNGTQSTGNLPLKAVAEVSAAFVHPPPLETRIGDVVYRFRTEEEVWPVYFVHALAYGAGLAAGGPGRRWRLTPRGDRFFSVQASGQVRVLLHAWWYRVNWLISVPYNIFGEYLHPRVREKSLDLLTVLPPGRPVAFEPFVNRLIQDIGWTWNREEPDHTRGHISAAVEHMLVEPLEKLGVLSVMREKDPDSRFERLVLSTFSLTPLGAVLLDSLRQEHPHR